MNYQCVALGLVFLGTAYSRIQIFHMSLRRPMRNVAVVDEAVQQVVHHRGWRGF